MRQGDGDISLFYKPVEVKDFRVKITQPSITVVFDSFGQRALVSTPQKNPDRMLKITYYALASHNKRSRCLFSYCLVFYIVIGVPPSL